MPKRVVAFALLIALSGCGHLEGAVMPVVAEIAGSVDGISLVGGPPHGALADADVAAMGAPWSQARIAQARADNHFEPFSAFAPVIGDGFSADAYPLTHRVFNRLRTPLFAADSLSKRRYARARPFVADPAQPTCIRPTNLLRRNGSYPSGHAAFGWAWALLLTELAPARADAILQRGRDYGDSRIVCGVHYPSDVEAGRVIGAAAVARLHANPAFRRDLDAARDEFARMNSERDVN